MPQIRLTILDPAIAREFDVPLGVTQIGRELSTNLPIPNPQVSRRHAQLVSDGQICELIDLGSANGTFANDARLTPQAPITLEDGMRLRFGPVEVSVQIIPDAPVVTELPPDNQLAEEQPSADGASIPGGAGRSGVGTADAPSGEAEEPLPVDTPSASSTLPEEPEELVLDLPVEPSTPEKAVRDAIPMPQPSQQEPEPSAGPEPSGDIHQPAGPPDLPFLTAQPVEPPGSDGHDGAQPPNRPPSGAPWQDEAGQPENPFGLPGLSIYSRRLINNLPGIYQTDFMARFLGIFESIQTPIEWTVDSFDLYLDPDSSPAAFLSWLGSWFGLTFDASWTEEQRRILIGEAHAIFARRGTRWALARILQIYTGCDPLINDTGDGIEPFTFWVRLAIPDTAANRTLLTRLIDAHKPAYTTYRLELTP